MERENRTPGAHIKKNDTVVVLAGKDRGRKARVLRVYPSEGRAIVEGVNFMRKHEREAGGHLLPHGDGQCSKLGRKFVGLAHHPRNRMSGHGAMEMVVESQ